MHSLKSIIHKNFQKKLSTGNMKISCNTTATLLTVALYFMMMMSHVQATAIVRNHRDLLSSLTQDRHLDDDVCVNEALVLVVCFLQDPDCLTFDDDDDSLPEDIDTCEAYDEALRSFNTDLQGCICFDEYKAVLDCSAKEAGYNCNSNSSAITSSHKSALLISLMSMAIPFVAIFM
jgi:hypothetical protein